ILPTLAEAAGASLSEPLRGQVEGRSLLPLLKDPKAPWPDRYLVTHVGRWPRGRAAESKHAQCSIRNGRYTLVNNAELYDLEGDRGEHKTLTAAPPEAAAEPRAAYDRWGADVPPRLENEDAVGPKVNPFKERYWKQFGGGPDEALRNLMDPDK